MCDPVTATIVVMSVAAGVGSYNAYQEQKAANAAAQYNADVYERNAQIADMQAAEATAQGELEEKQYRLKLSQTQGQQRSALAAGGVVVDEGSAYDVLEDTVAYGELDALTIRRNAAVEAWGYKNEAIDYRAQASLLRSTKRSPWAAAGSSLLTSASKIGQFASSSGGTGGGS